jgi:hypothetical protein
MALTVRTRSSIIAAVVATMAHSVDLAPEGERVAVLVDPESVEAKSGLVSWRF